MSWNRHQIQASRVGKMQRRGKLRRVRLCGAQCGDCGRDLAVTHLVERFGGRCRPCWDALVASPSFEVASH